MRLVFEVYTPVFIMGGGQAMRDVDYFEVGGRAYLVDWLAAEVEGDSFERARAALKRALERGRRVGGVVELRLASSCGELVHLGSPEGVPPSSVKGLLRTAYIYRRLKRDPALLDELAKEVERKVEEGAPPKFFFSGFERRLMRRAVDESRSYDLFNRVAVRALSSKYTSSIYCVEVKKRGGGVEARFTAVGIDPGSRFEFEVQVREAGLGQELVEALREFSRDLAEFERGRGLEVPSCGLPLRLGFGAGRRWKTVLNLLEGKAAFHKLTDYMSRRGKAWGDSTVKTVGGRPVGWVCGHVF